MKVVAALSGGVDSAVAAARVVQAGHDVTGVHLALASTPEARRSGSRGCCSLEDARDARRVADVLGIPFYVWDVAEKFREEVIEDFISEYAAGRTPNPCLRCNEKIKFEAVLERAMALGFDAVATGHYAQLRVDGDEIELSRAADEAKDQSYVLAVLNKQQLLHSMFPLGDTVKGDVRQEAADLGLLVADKPDSHDICFIANGDTKGWLEDHLGSKPGEIKDAVTGDVLGMHNGAHAYTVGQRRGLGVSVADADGARRYVVDVNVRSNTVLIGLPTMLDVDIITGERIIWCGARADLAKASNLHVQVRAHGQPVPAAVEVIDGLLVAKTTSRIRGVAAGQAMVIYDGPRVLGSATICSTGLQ